MNGGRRSLIHIIETAHGKTQYWSDLIRKGELLDTCPVIVERFELYLRDAAISINATTIAEEKSNWRAGHRSLRKLQRSWACDMPIATPIWAGAPPWA